jgi:hypothetical protein
MFSLLNELLISIDLEAYKSKAEVLDTLNQRVLVFHADSLVHPMSEDQQ